MSKSISPAKHVPAPPESAHTGKAEKPQSLFEMMQVLSATQRQRFGEVRRKWKAKPGVREAVEKSGDTWVVRYYVGKTAVAEARFLPQELEFNEL